ncbi:hypothetical protein EV356DRAFT_563383 [Viridothelium virens]|uniref:Zn(2)-C6 fungal-type domain-containing protein n=1 Tax=Viridothelium virens TaxID=1048519 RepID=A0A6A6HN59_VIRVR|nr:hypothetical protein EV356DRAFT_563383 [Viridothelium virens]
MEDASQASFPKRRSCARCIKAKVKCSVIQGRDICERCHRLNRDCEFGNVDLRRRRKTATRTERLEKRIEELAAQLAAQQNESLQPSNSTHTSSPEAAPAGMFTPPVSEDIDPATLGNAASSGEAFNQIYFLRKQQEAEGDVVDRGFITPTRAELLLEKYRTVKMPSFPFVIIPAGKTATDLRRESPFLFLAIMTVCLEDDIPLQGKIVDEIRSEISKRMILGDKRNLELLQGLLVHLGWYHYHFSPLGHQMYLLLNLARALIFELCLDRSPNANAEEQGILMEIKKKLALTHKVNEDDDVANGKRAVLGFYYVSSILCMCRKGLAMKFTPWLDECCRSLKERNQYPTDASIERFIKLRLLHQNISDTLLNDGQVECHSDSVLEMSQTAFQNELSTLEAGLPALSSVEQYALEVECLIIAVAIHEIALYTGQPSCAASIARTKSLSSLLRSSRALLNFCLRVPDDAIQHLSLATITMFWYAILVLAKVVLIPSAPGWDRETAKKEADLAGLGRAAKDKLTSVRLTQKQCPDSLDVWTYFCHVMRSMLIWNKKQEQPDKEDPVADGIRNASDALAIAKYNNDPCALVDQPTPPAAADCVTDPIGEEETARIAEVDTSPDMSQESWFQSPDEFLDDSLWQRVLDDFTLLPPAPFGGYPAGAFAPFGYP